MITRRHIRVKTVQLLYAYSYSKNTDNIKPLYIETYKNNLSLYYNIISVFVALKPYIKEKLKISSQKYFIDNNEILCLEKFSNNKLFKFLDIEYYINKKELINWKLNSKVIEGVYKSVKQKLPEILKNDSKDDHKIFAGIFKKCIAPNEQLIDFLTSSKLTWADDYAFVNTFILKKLNKFSDDCTSSYFIEKEFKNKEDEDFSRDLLKNITAYFEELVSFIDNNTPNWDLSRIAKLDLIILIVGLGEMKFFPNTPKKVVINEYIEIAKNYSTQKSSSFINGVLDLDKVLEIF